MNATVQYPLTIYYDSACPICRTEMTTLMALDGHRRLQLFDCAGGVRDAACVDAGLTTADLLARIRARDADGRWIDGVDVFIAAYEAAGLAALAAVFAHRRLRPVWDHLYPWIARHRYGLSRIGLHHLFRLIPHRRLHAAARRAAAASAACAIDGCDLGARHR